jgi:hypothetical protein
LDRAEIATSKALNGLHRNHRKSVFVDNAVLRKDRLSSKWVAEIATAGLEQGCQIFLGTNYQKGEKYAKLP